jgi:hypothetical protein
MQSKFIEATNGPQNWGKFMVGRFTQEEWMTRSAVEPERGLIAGRGWSRDHLLVVDLQTGEGAIFRPGGVAGYDLNKHAIWVCPLFEPFLTWLYEQDLSDLDALPAYVDLPDAEFMMSGYRRPGPAGVKDLTDEEAQAIVQVLTLAENHQMWRDPAIKTESFKDFADEQYAAITKVRELLKDRGILTIHEATNIMAEAQGDAAQAG